MNHSNTGNVSYVYAPGTKNVLATIDRTYADTIDIKLSCGYRQRFWLELTDEQAYRQILKMKEHKIESA